MKVFEWDTLIFYVSKQPVMHFFKPSVLTIVLTGLLVVAAYGGHIQTYAFTCGADGHKCEGTGIEKPALYDTFRYCPCWGMWVISTAPLFYTGAPYLVTTLEGAIISVIYYYLLSCLLAFFWRKFRNIKWFDEVPQVKS